MANKNLFQSLRGALTRRPDTRNLAGGVAYSYAPEHGLAQLACTGCLNGTYYADAGAQLDAALELCAQVEPEAIAKIAVYARREGHMKDMPALLLAVLAVRDGELLERVFDRVVDNGRMLRNFVQIVRSGVTGRKSLGSRPKRLVRRWLEARDGDALFRDSIGSSPSIRDVLRMVHPRPATDARRALYGYLLGREHDAAQLPASVREFEGWKRVQLDAATREGAEPADVPDVPFQLLAGHDLTREQWTRVALQAPWQTLRMNLNTFLRHGVFEDEDVTLRIAERLADPAAVARARVFPYQIFNAYVNTSFLLPGLLRDALHDAMEAAVQSVPRFEGNVVVCPDVSGSMHASVSGYRKGATSKVRCVDVAALVSAAVLRKNPRAQVLPFSDHVCPVRFSGRDSVLTNAERLASLPAGGTDCSAPLRELNRARRKVDLVLFVSDNQSWIRGDGYGQTEVLQQWNKLRRRSPQARLVCIDIQPYLNAQAPDREDVLNVGGFSDQVFQIVADFASGELEAEHWSGVIDRTRL